MAEFDGIRARLYKEALEEYPEARKGDLNDMKKFLAPKAGENILEVGAGNGLFSGEIADLILPDGELIVSDPSSDQLEGIKKLNKSNIKVIQGGADQLNLTENYFDAIWSFGAFHHCFNKQKSFENFYTALKPGGRLVIGDVFTGSDLAKHFDDKVAKYCVTGHEVSFLSKEYAESLCFLSDFQVPSLVDFNSEWEFDSRESLGVFLYKLHAMTKITPAECLKGAEEILGAEQREGKVYLNWPMTFLITKKT